MRTQLENLIRKAGKILLEKQASQVITKEGHANYVTDIDLFLQEYLIEELAALCPGSKLIGEQKENEALTDSPTWVIDPLDGTTNFIHDFKVSAISIGLLENRVPVLGCVYHPYLDELYSAEAGKGAWLNGKPIHTSDTPFERALVGFGTAPYNPELSRASMEAAALFLRDSADIRRTGSAAIDLAYVACGRLDAFFELSLKPWDYAAGSLLVKEAGGVFEMPMLKEADYNAVTGVMAANRNCVAPVMERLNPVLEKYGLKR